MADVKPQTWADNSKEIVASVANWMLVECVATNTRWNSLTDGDGLVLLGMERATEVATHRGIPLGTFTLTPGELLGAMQDLAKASLAPTHPLPEAPVVEAPLAAGTAPFVPPDVTSGGAPYAEDATASHEGGAQAP